MGKNIFFCILSLIVSFCVIEGSAYLYIYFAKPKPIDYGQGFNKESRIFVIENSNESKIKINPSKLNSFNDQSFYLHKKEGDLRIAFLGGSSVNYLHPHLEQMQEKLKESLHILGQVEIITVGGLSYGTHRLVPALAEVLNYQPDIVVLYSGHNEFEEVEQLHLAALRFSKLNSLFSNSAFYRVLQNLYTKHQIKKLLVQHNLRILSNSQPNVARAWRYNFTKQDIAERMNQYEINLQTMISMCNQKKVDFIICTVPSNLISPYLPEEQVYKYLKINQYLKQGKYIEAREFGKEILKNTTGRHQSSDLENNIIKKLAINNSLAMADVEKAITEQEPHKIPGELLFDDHCHLNGYGNNILIKTVSDTIISVILSQKGNLNP